ncbi:hypothetical protein GOB94_09935 [Granulicella sp. 5B5]|uniref:hypothetical protein n=1 Tax=Granulicella sp. 5B5 TaxID=1617967 RepID=UPI0015F45286|nr:hypothetical protein [Granulicella sp. 5B5]QMV18955.1 hypothetical protein GOB94_09935 [Granulicella sp. 5B5]
MLDVHAPEHGIHNVREFFLHLFTITCGLLIALGLEAGVEAAHHRHQREEAEATIRQELEANRAELVAAQTTWTEEIKSLAAAIQYMEAQSTGRDVPRQAIQLGFSEDVPKDAAWRTASSTGVLMYMDYATAEDYSACYKEQDEYAQMERQTANDYLQVDALVETKAPEDVTKEDFAEGLPLARKTLADMMGLKAIREGTTQAYDDALGKK